MEALACATGYMQCFVNEVSSFSARWSQAVPRDLEQSGTAVSVLTSPGPARAARLWSHPRAALPGSRGHVEAFRAHVKSSASSRGGGIDLVLVIIPGPPGQQRFLLGPRACCTHGARIRLQQYHKGLCSPGLLPQC